MITYEKFATYWNECEQRLSILNQGHSLYNETELCQLFLQGDDTNVSSDSTSTNN